MKRVAALCAALALSACGAREAVTLQGYAEADYLYIAPQDPGLVAALTVREGAQVAAGDTLFALNTERAEASYAAAEAQSQASRARAATAAIAAARANASLAAATLARTQMLYDQNFVAQARLDQDQAALDAARAEVRRLEAERAAAAQSDEAQDAQASLARTQLADRVVRAPAAGRVERIFRRAGEYTQPGEPVLALLAPANMKLRFFAPEALLPRLALGQTVRVTCNGCEDGISARISFIDSAPQFTPPVIYSTEEREKLVYLIEARPNRPDLLRPGQPLDIHLDAAP
jgi:HlyD family secretion protein